MTPASGRHVILYDGICGLCNRVVWFVIRNDPGEVFHFATLQSEAGKEILARHGREPRLDTFYVVAEHRRTAERLLRKGRGVIYLLRSLGWPWKLAVVFGILPTFALNWGYDLVARTRYRLFGKLEACPVPRPEYRRRFLDS